MLPKEFDGLEPDEITAALTFVEQYRATLAAIKSCGALSDDTTPILVAKYAIVIAADEFKPSYDPYRAELANLRHFV